jgi:hypothetical protein
MNKPWHSSLDCCDFSNTFANMLREAYRFLTEEFDVDFKAIVCLILAGISLVLSTGFQLYTKIRYILWFLLMSSKFFNFHTFKYFIGPSSQSRLIAGFAILTARLTSTTEIHGRALNVINTMDSHM